MNISLSKFCRDYGLPKSSVFVRCQEMGINTSEGLDEAAVKILENEFDVQQAVTPESRTVSVEVGNHQVALAAPQIPQAYSLEGLRQSEVVQFEDPLAIAHQFMQAADLVIAGMDQDVESRQKRLSDTVKAKEAITAKKQQLELEARLYQMQTNHLNAQTSKETADLQSALAALQNLGKPAQSGSSSQG